MRICGFAGEGLRGERFIHETFPVKELQDYWSTRPTYDDAPGASAGAGSSSQGGAAQSYQDWLTSQNGKEGDEPPPPPYTLEADEAAAAAEPTTTAATSAQSAPPNVESTSTPAPPQPLLATRPQAPQPALSTRPGGPTVSPRPDPVFNLASNLNRVSIADQVPPAVGAVSQPIPDHSQQQSIAFPQATAGTAVGTSGPWAQEEWPPREWNAGSAPTTSSYPGMAVGPDRMRVTSIYNSGYGSAPPPLPPRQGSGSGPSFPVGTLNAPPANSSYSPHQSPPTTQSGSPYSNANALAGMNNYFPGRPTTPQPHPQFQQAQAQYPYPSYQGSSYNPPYHGVSQPQDTRPSHGQAYALSTSPGPIQGQGPPSIPPRELTDDSLETNTNRYPFT
jgi:hypothetical protein